MGLASDLQVITPRAAAYYIKQGKQFGSQMVINQGNQTLNGLAVHREVLAECGFSGKDEVRLREGVEMLDGLLGDRGGEKGRRKGLTKREGRLVGEAKQSVAKGLVVVEGVISDLRNDDSKEAEQAQGDLEVMREAIQRGAKNEDTLPGAMRDLHKALSHPKAVALADDRGGVALREVLLVQADGLKKIQEARALRPGTPEHTARLDLLDGIVLELVRRARKSAKAAARAKGQPVIERAFLLDQLYSSDSQHDDDDATDNTDAVSINQT